jgi:hypothetical protein
MDDPRVQQRLLPWVLAAYQWNLNNGAMAECVSSGNSAYCSGFGPSNWTETRDPNVTHLTIDGQMFSPTYQQLTYLYPAFKVRFLI